MILLKGKVHKFIKQDGNDNDINTYYIISGRYKFQYEDYNELVTHIIEDLASDF